MTSGERFGRLVTVSKFESEGPPTWLCRCDCGKTKVTKQRNLRSGHTRSCGCLVGGRFGATHGMTRTPTYISWEAMRGRCTYEKHKKYHLYGGAGVQVCDRWLHSFEAFLEDVGERPEGMTLDRFPNPAGNYEPGNVRWATPLTQRYNIRAPEFSIDDVNEVRGRHEHGESIKSIARRVRRSPSAIRKIVHRRTWSHVP